MTSSGELKTLTLITQMPRTSTTQNTAYSSPYLRDTVQPRVEGVTAHAQVRLVELVFLGPAERRVAEPLLDDGVEPGQQEVQPGPLVGLLGRGRGEEGEGGGGITYHTQTLVSHCVL